MTGELELSVVIAIVGGGREPIAACLSALERSARRHAVECIVPYDARLPEVDRLAARFGWVDFVDGREQLDTPRYREFSGERSSLLRCIGLKRARGRLVALLDDQGTPAPDWCDAVIEAHRHACSAVGGAVENGGDRPLQWAVYYCDFGRYQSPLPTGIADFLPCVNVAYKRAALEGVAELWIDAFPETVVNVGLQRRREDLLFDAGMVVYYTRWRLRLSTALRERYALGRSFAATRAAGLTPKKRAFFAAVSFGLPGLLTWRIVSRAVRRRRHLGPLLRALPLIVLLQTIRSYGEFVGYLTGDRPDRPGKRRCPA